MSVEIQTKAAVTVAEMARMVGLSRARFYQLQKAGVFPPPLYDVSTFRPVYVEELQEVCLEVRRRNYGINGRPVLFYARRNSAVPGIPRTRRKASPVRATNHTALLDGLTSLGLAFVTPHQVGEAVQELFPQGTPGIDPVEVLRAVFVHLKRRS
jgi:hypothetical protein